MELLNDIEDYEHESVLAMKDIRWRAENVDICDKDYVLRSDVPRLIYINERLIDMLDALKDEYIRVVSVLDNMNKSGDGL